jgi:hypothetical protein
VKIQFIDRDGDSFIVDAEIGKQLFSIVLQSRSPNSSILVGCLTYERENYGLKKVENG